MIQEVKHIDGKWFTSDFIIEDFKVQIKMRQNHGCKVHIFNNETNKVLKTFRYHFASQDFLLKKAKQWIELKKEDKPC